MNEYRDAPGFVTCPDCQMIVWEDAHACPAETHLERHLWWTNVLGFWAACIIVGAFVGYALT